MYLSGNYDSGSEQHNKDVPNQNASCASVQYLPCTGGVLVSLYFYNDETQILSLPVGTYLLKKLYYNNVSITTLFQKYLCQCPVSLCFPLTNKEITLSDFKLPTKFSFFKGYHATLTDLCTNFFRPNNYKFQMFVLALLSEAFGRSKTDLHNFFLHIGLTLFNCPR